MKKHAYLIQAHDQFGLLKMLVQELDDPLNDIYIHIDKKSKNFDRDNIKSAVQRSKTFFVDSISVVWGGESQIRAELRLFKAAYNNEQEYIYYHLISGVDYPIKTQKEIHDYFEKNRGKEFIEYWDRDLKSYEYRIKYRYPLQEKIGRYTNDPKTIILRLVSKVLVFFQYLCRIDRVKDYEGNVKIGGQWVSLSDEFVGYLLEQEITIHKYFLKGVAADELFIQSICWNSKFRDNVFSGGHQRLIDWNRGSPYTWQEDDFNEIICSDKLFIRKVTEKNGLPNQLHEFLLNKKELE